MASAWRNTDHAGGRGALPRARAGLSFVLLCALLLVLWVAGGASRADAAGQLIVRSAAWLTLIAAALFADPPVLRMVKPVAVLVFLAVLLAVLQLVPLPPAVWQALPGRDLLVDAAALSGQPQPWRPWSIVPGATHNALSSLIVPVAVLILAGGLVERERRWLPGMLLALVAASMLVGLLQFSGAGFDNPFVNDTPGQVSGMFANRNHFALFLAIGCLLAPAWTFEENARANWRGPMALALVVLFELTILATGSRAGMILGMIALATGLALIHREIRRSLRRRPRWVFPVILAALGAVLIIPVLLSIAAGRAASIDRLFAVDPGQDMRGRGLPVVLDMVRTYLPWGTGLGGFDPMFRMREPFGLLKLTFFNHAHNDLIEIVLDAGLAGLALLLSAVLWWALASARAWRSGAGVSRRLPRLGSSLLLLVLVASVFDYPARTPVIMAMIVIAGVWLDDGPARRGGSALPHSPQHL